MKKTKIIAYYDPDTTATAFLAAAEYGVSIIDTEPDGENQAKITVYGEAEAVDALLEDVESGDVRPMCGWRDLDDDEYMEQIRLGLLGSKSPSGIEPRLDGEEAADGEA